MVEATNQEEILTNAPTYLGRPVLRVEDSSLLTGRGEFVDDLGVKPGTLHAAILRSAHAHAQIESIDTSAALAVPGVRTVLTGDDVKAWAAPFAVGVRQPMEHWCMAVDRVRYVGEPVAVVVAESRYVAEDALDLIRVQYRVHKAVVDPETALLDDAPVLHEAVGSNLVNDRHFCYGDPDAAFAAADQVVSLKIQYPRNSCTPIECFAVVAEHLPDQKGYDVLSNFQGPFALHPVMARALKVSGARLRLRSPRDSGGSFGTKQAVSTYVVLLCLAARKACAPVKWVEDRLEHLQASVSATNRVTTLEAAVRANGEILALKYDQIDDCGAYLRAPEPATFYRMHGMLTGAYKIKHVAARNRVVLTNKTPSGLVRGFGGPQMYFALERLVQRVAAELGLDPLEVIRSNLLDADAFPYRAPAGALYDSGNYQAALRQIETEGGLAELIEHRDQARREGRLYGIGYAAIVEPSISNMGYITTAMTPKERAKAGLKNGAITSATINIDGLGSVSVLIDSIPQGQGHRTVIAQVVADELGLDPADITVNTEHDTQKDSWSIAAGNYSSRFAGAVAGTAHLAAQKVRTKLAGIAANLLNVSADELVFADRKIYATTHPAEKLSFHRVAGAAHWAPGTLPPGMTPGLRETVFWTPPQLTAPDDNDMINSSAVYGLVFDMCGVEVDRVTGKIRIDRYVSLHDAGTILNPALADGQTRGGFAQGVGAALMEEFTYGDDGSFLAGTFADYLVPTCCEVPDLRILHMQTPSPFTPLGSKGIGEGNNMSTPVCIANAVADALGVADIRLPLTPSRVLNLLSIDDPPPRAGLDTLAESPVVDSNRSGLAMNMSGSVDLEAPPQQVYDVLLDPQALARVVPGCHSLTQVADNHYQAEVTLGVGLVKARYVAEIRLSELDPPHSLSLGGSGVSSLGSAEGEGRVRLEPHEGGTRLHYDYGVSVNGKVAAVGSRMLEGAARIVLRQLFEQLGRQAQGELIPGAPSFSWKRLLNWLGVRK
ncbi:molybdopterin cofactor-binding domain-containing protein [Neopusillimonas maritima]|uniref:xanthine dehydrogenase family protein molybdopterin-binding subunit n=1 Tax=Neopusillimonas maritima TaxID=2026239 RepID=UPI001FE93EC3|nr:molybdopterin cofactor-binding domain-containing protein [Neopusillimonas maritima]